VSIASSPPPSGRDALTLRDDGLTTNPQTPTEWDEWVSAGKTRNWCNDDPLLDWLARHGRAKGFVPDDELKGFDSRTDFLGFVLAHGKLFEQKILELLGTRADVSTPWSAAASAMVTSCRISCSQISYFFDGVRNRFTRLPARSAPRDVSVMIRSSKKVQRSRRMLSD